MAVADQGIFNQASAFGTNSAAHAQTGNLQTANAIGAHSTADAVHGTLDMATAVAPGSTAVAGGASSALPSINATATAVGTGSIAVAGASHTTAGNVDFALAIGSMLDATATGRNLVVNIVFQPCDCYLWISLLRVKMWLCLGTGGSNRRRGHPPRSPSLETGRSYGFSVRVRNSV